MDYPFRFLSLLFHDKTEALFLKHSIGYKLENCYSENINKDMQVLYNNMHISFHICSRQTSFHRSNIAKFFKSIDTLTNLYY